MALGWQVAGVDKVVPVEGVDRPTTPNAVSGLEVRVDKVEMAALVRRSVQWVRVVPTGPRAAVCVGADRNAPA